MQEAFAVAAAVISVDADQAARKSHAGDFHGVRVMRVEDPIPRSIGHGGEQIGDRAVMVAVAADRFAAGAGLLLEVAAVGIEGVGVRCE